MTRVRKLEEINSIKAGPKSTILEDGTIVNPEEYHAVNVYLDDGRIIQVERPLIMGKIRAALSRKTVDEVSEGDEVENTRA